jgi:COMPASS component BRE2
MARMKNVTQPMSEPSPLSTTPTIPQKRPFALDDEQHVPAVSSPLNPDSAAARTRKQPAREQREKKESLRKREAKGSDGTRHGTPDTPSQAKKSKKSIATAIILSPIRYKLAPPKPTDFDPPRAPVLTPTHTRAGRQFHESSEQYVFTWPFLPILRILT